MEHSSKNHLKDMFKHLVIKDKKFFILIAIYGVIVALLNLALPLSVQVLITSIIYTALVSPVIVLGFVLLFLLSFSAILTLLQKFLIEIYKRNNFARMSAEIMLKAIYSEHQNFREYNTSDLSSRYFEIFSIQRNASELIVDGFLIFLTILVSFTLSSFYHPYFLILNLIIVILIWFSWKLFSKQAIDRAIYLSEVKFKVFAWIDDIFRRVTFFKTEKNKEFAIAKGHSLVSEYINARKRYWHVSFAQHIILVVIYVAVTIVLITVGSILVIKGQLALGQLVAAEILYTTSLYGVSKLAIYYDKFYNLMASLDEMNHLLKINNENIVNDSVRNIATPHNNTPIIKLNNVLFTDSFKVSHKINLAIAKNSCNLILATNQILKTILVDLLINVTTRDAGIIEFNGVHIADLNQQQLRDQIVVVDNANLFGTTIEEFLTYGISQKMQAQLNHILDIVDISDSIEKLDKRFNTVLINDGYPLDEEHIILLKIAKALLTEPQVLIINEVFDKISLPRQQNLLKYIKEAGKITLLCFTANQDNHVHFDNFILLTEQQTYIADNCNEITNIASKLLEKNQ